MESVGPWTHKNVHAELDLARFQNLGFEFRKDLDPRTVSFKEHNLSTLVNLMHCFQCTPHAAPRRKPMLEDKTPLTGRGRPELTAPLHHGR